MFERAAEGQRVLAAVNADPNPYTARFDLGGSRGRDLISGEERELHGELYLPPMSCAYWEILG